MLGSRKTYILLLIVGFSLAIASCERDKSADPVDVFCADPIENPSYSDHIVPIMDLYCYECHDNENNVSLADGWDLEDHADIFPLAKDGTLLGCVRHDPGFTPMPLDGDRIPLCDILTFENWIMNGAPNN